MLVTGNDATQIEVFKKDMIEVFEMTYLGEMHYFLGMEIKQSQNEVFICQKKYMKEILKRFYMEECKSVSTPMNQKEKLQKTDGADSKDEKVYRSLVECLMYLTSTRPYIVYTISVLSIFIHCTSEIHMIAAKRVLRYLNGTLAYGINFSKVEKFKLQGFSDSDWAESLDDMRNTSATTAVNKALWLKKQMDDLHLKQEGVIEVFVDNQVTLAISLNLVWYVKENCTFRVSETNAEKEPTPPEVAPKNHSMVVDGHKEKCENYRPWMLVERKSRRKVRDFEQKKAGIQGKFWKDPFSDPCLMLI
ncbi:uncharacterized mitochondrial protein AtMg00810-like [Gossypium raimondii]|uniref:uncharacterized mitochondrial protein AtMg00810-like n=1 Tax=Gossypium raimondii TaxID=29730 RepID=UPI00227D5013|nr:uncharacterized mitochondrial protein AtMg00810-like [Gossypium raimondii]